MILRYIHSALIFSVFIPFIYAIGELEDPAGTLVLFIKCFLIIVPVILTDKATKHVRSMIVYIIICIALTLGAAFLTGTWYRHETYQVCYSVGFILETVFISVVRIKDRLKEAQRRINKDPFAAIEKSFLNKPSLYFLEYFTVMYIVGICFNSKALCDIAFFSAVVYLFLAIAYIYMETSKAYLELNKRTKGIPKKRLYGISSAMLAGFCAVLFVSIIPSIVLAGQRNYTDIREWFDDVELVPYDYQGNMEFQPAASGDMTIIELTDEIEPAPQPSKFVNTIFWIIGIFCILCFLYSAFLGIKQMLKDFRNSFDENGDKIEELEEEQILYKEEFMKIIRHRNDSEAERVRRKYRKTIRKHRKDIPALYESPDEIEEKAGLKEDEDMKQLHKEYEYVRYGR